MMIFVFLACSSNMEKAALQDATTEFDTATESANDFTDVGESTDSVTETVSWWKLAVDIQGIELDGYTEYSVVAVRDLYDQDMNWVCQQSLDIASVVEVSGRVDNAMIWLLVDIAQVQGDCLYEQDLQQMEIGIGTLVQDIAIVQDMVDWRTVDERNTYVEQETLGSYIVLDDVVWAFGVAYVDVSTDMGWIIRPIYAFPW